MFEFGMESWFANFTQFVRGWTTKETLANIPRPYTEYAVWGFFKGGEAASVVGGCIVHPIYRFYLHKRLTPEKTTPNSDKVIRNICRKLQGRFLLAGMFVGPVIASAYVRFNGKSEEEMRDICYAIRCDTPALTVDRFAFVFGFIGWYWKRFQGAVDGINFGLAYGLFNNKVLTELRNPILQDAVKPQERFESVVTAHDNRSELAKFLAEKDRAEQTKAA